MTQYRRGYEFERRVSAHLRDEGYFVMESRGSHGVADQVAIKLGEVLAVQCKITGTISTDDWNALYAACQAHGMVPLLAQRQGRGLVFQRLTDYRVARSHFWPLEPWTADRVGAT